MRAIVIESARGRTAVGSVPEPVAPADGVVVRVMATGLCRSDWHAWAGHDSDVVFPHVPGHELAGIVVETGPDVRDWKPGDRVTVPFVCGCGRCEWCRSGNAQVCPDQQQPGFTHAGSFAEYVALHAADANLVAIPDGVEFATAASLGCRFATAYRALAARARVQEGEWVTVIGAGGVGLSAVMIARAIGARTIAVDRNPEALAVAEEIGAEHTLLAGDGIDIPTAVSALTGGGSHVSVDAVGSEQTSADGVLSLRRRGRHVQIGLLPAVEGRPRVPMDRVIAWELDVLGSHGMSARDYPPLMAFVEQGALQPQLLIQRTIGLAEAAELLPRFDTATVAGMTMIDPAR
ncbi:zinc-dependent alcohol dehydrogenase family protein [Microbacterium capsulatum]|uniref:Zinc-dependent alcohol dehydrogenase family protein n=1 Tax=Microbacterium capsulatum TaxID=3041921 RepID=A0ABU0XKA7_9MICO|nr:zinc-dependent alcohol dehydrogenase family protein [Microbacterium sp. ASV81]MDQ4215577.1 zinc-dependent alcohol dehydrogenase family protein [Microbacterium sp. ASV81]